MFDFKKAQQKKQALKRNAKKDMVNELFVKTGQYDKLIKKLKNKKSTAVNNETFK